MIEPIKFWTEQGCLMIDVHGYQYPAAEDKDDANWLSCVLTVKAGPFAGAFNSSFTTYDLVHLHEDLTNRLAALSGIVTFQNTENDIELTIEFNKLGGAILSGAAHPNKSLEGSLHFRLETDQSALGQTLRQLETALRHFPVKQAQ